MPNSTVNFETSLGDLEVEIFEDRVPKAAAYFLRLVEEHYYDGLHFHRIAAPAFVELGCANSRDPDHPRIGVAVYPYEERVEVAASLPNNKNELGTLAMHTGGYGVCFGSSRFIINAKPNYVHDSSELVFGVVSAGLEVVRTIVASKAIRERPVNPILVSRVEVRDRRRQVGDGAHTTPVEIE